MLVRVWVRSIPGMYEQYNGYVDVNVNKIDDAKNAAVNKLRSTTFPNRNASMWKMEKVEIL